MSRRMTREEFDRRYWKSEGPENVPASTRREFYSDYKESGLSFAAYVRQTTTQANPSAWQKELRKTSRPARSKFEVVSVEFVREGTYRLNLDLGREGAFPVTVYPGGYMQSGVADLTPALREKIEKWLNKNAKQLHPNPRRRKNGRLDALSAGDLDRSIAALEAREKKLRKQAAAPGKVPGRVRMWQDAEYLAHDIAEMKAELARRLSRSNPRTRKNGPTLDRPSYPFTEMEERYATYTDAQLAYALKDAREAARNEDELAKRGHRLAQYGWYADDVHTVAAEIRRRQTRKNPRSQSKKRN
jgi:hypothetical protein